MQFDPEVAVLNDGTAGTVTRIGGDYRDFDAN